MRCPWGDAAKRGKETCQNRQAKRKETRTKKYPQGTQLQNEDKPCQNIIRASKKEPNIAGGKREKQQQKQRQYLVA